VIALVLVLGATAVLALALLPPLHPAQMWAVVWALAVGAYAMKLFPYQSLGDTTQLLIGGATLGFVGGTLAGERLSTSVAGHRRWQRAPFETADLETAATMVLALSLLGLTAFLVQAGHAYGLRATLLSSSQVRAAVQVGTFKFTIKYVYAAIAASALCGACAGMTPHRRRWGVSSVVIVLSTYFTTGRATVVVAAVVALCAYAVGRPRPLSKRVLMVGGCALAILAGAIFTIGGSLIGKTFEHSEIATINSVFERHHSLNAAALPYEYLRLSA
jgi:hypothetical protein